MKVTFDLPTGDMDRLRALASTRETTLTEAMIHAIRTALFVTGLRAQGIVSVQAAGALQTEVVWPSATPQRKRGRPRKR